MPTFSGLIVAHSDNRTGILVPKMMHRNHQGHRRALETCYSSTSHVDHKQRRPQQESSHTLPRIPHKPNNHCPSSSKGRARRIDEGGRPRALTPHRAHHLTKQRQQRHADWRQLQQVGVLHLRRGRDFRPKKRSKNRCWSPRHPCAPPCAGVCGTRPSRSPVPGDGRRY